MTNDIARFRAEAASECDPPRERVAARFLASEKPFYLGHGGVAEESTCHFREPRSIPPVRFSCRTRETRPFTFALSVARFISLLRSSFSIVLQFIPSRLSAHK